MEQLFPDLHLDLGDQASLIRKAVKLVLKLRPEWTNEDQARHKVFSGGYSNILVGIYQEGHKVKESRIKAPYVHSTSLT